MVSTLQTDSNKQADVDRLASLKADHESKRHHCESGLSQTPLQTPALAGETNRATNGSERRKDSLVEVILNRIALGAARHNGPELGENC